MLHHLMAEDCIHVFSSKVFPEKSKRDSTDYSPFVINRHILNLIINTVCSSQHHVIKPGFICMLNSTVSRSNGILKCCAMPRNVLRWTTKSFLDISVWNSPAQLQYSAMFSSLI